MHPGRTVLLRKFSGVTFQAFYDKMNFGVGVINLPWIILYLVYTLAVACFTGE